MVLNISRSQAYITGYRNTVVNDFDSDVNTSNITLLHDHSDGWHGVSNVSIQSPLHTEISDYL